MFGHAYYSVRALEIRIMKVKVKIIYVAQGTFIYFGFSVFSSVFSQKFYLKQVRSKLRQWILTMSFLAVMRNKS